jgi:hypothetical protein
MGEVACKEGDVVFVLLEKRGWTNLLKYWAYT